MRVGNASLFTAVVIALIGVGCSSKKEPAPVYQVPDIQRLLSYMEGSFSSLEQSEADSNYADIRLEMERIWEQRDDGYWLYVEQAEIGQLNKPYRQRVYHLTQLDSITFQSTVYTVPDPDRFIGHYRRPTPLEDLTPDSLIEKEGCAIVLRKVGPKAFSGGTVGKTCKNDWGGAEYITSEVMITEREIYSWDRGFDAEGRQVWGPERSGYIFKRKSPLVSPDDV